MAALAIAGAALAQPPDTILFNGRIVTLDAESSVHQALAIRDGRIVALGTNAQIKKLVGRESRGQDSIVDLKGPDDESAGSPNPDNFLSLLSSARNAQAIA